MKVIRKTKQEAIIYLDEKINIANSAELKEILQSLCTENCQTITVDFSHTRIIDSSCLGILLMFQKRLKEKKGEIIIKNVTSDYIRQMFTLIHLSKVIDVR
ncbi:MAG TPA: STAS domain-containing protein [Firmicutes bacterium]|jgi:anti-sigma B factor antagonist|nr:STAS domain-containing protein [Bacillota bacterium]